LWNLFDTSIEEGIKLHMTISDKVEKVVCDYCGSEKAVPVAKQKDLFHHTTDEFFTIVQCSSCALQYTNPRPTQTSIGNYYSSSYSYHSTPSYLRTLAYRIARIIANNDILAFFAGLIPSIGNRLVPFVKPSIIDPVRNYYSAGGIGAMLDIGCGSGVSANFWGENGSLLSYKKNMNVAGVEISNTARKSLEDKGVEIWARIDDVPKERLFGLIRMNWSLEHVHYPSRYFEFISDHLEIGGQAVIAVPNYEGLLYKLSPNCVELPVHLYHFTPSDIKKYAKKYGLKVCKLNTFSYPGMFLGAVQAGMLPESFVTNYGLSQARNFQSTLARFDKAGWGNDLIAVLERE